MREFLFRAKTTSKEAGEFNNIWVMSDLIHSGGRYYIHPPGTRVNVGEEISKRIVMHEVVPETICLDTGLTNKKGQKIWENDIVKALSPAAGYAYIGTIKSTETGYKIHWSNGDELLRKDIMFWITKRELYVIGNVFDNPELLEIKTLY